ncbi:MAG: FHA domain-containing protein [Pyrinomonadaceae bacterium]
MIQSNGRFKILFADAGKPDETLDKEAIVIGRLSTCDVVLDHGAVSRIHAGINYLDSNYFLINLSSSNVLSINGRGLEPQETDVLANGDTIQVGPFAVAIEIRAGEINLRVRRQSTGDLRKETPSFPSLRKLSGQRIKPEEADVLKVFWEKRTRDKEDWGTRLRPTEKPQPGKLLINWKPTHDLRRPWRFGLFVWALLIVGSFAAIAYWKYPQSYVGKPLASAHADNIEGSTIAVMANGNSCTTCHRPDEPIENACISCHQAEQFHVSNTQAHQNAGVTCIVCHREHQGADFLMKDTAIQTCAECHNDENKQLYNGKAVRTAHGGSYGYPSVDGKWIWKGMYSEVAQPVPAVVSSVRTAADEQTRLSNQFHAVHVSRLSAPEGVRGDSGGRTTCSSCHTSFDPIDRETPKRTCAACHEQKAKAEAAPRPNCISCHVQHPFSAGRWSEFLRDDALKLRKTVVNAQIKRLNKK